MSVFRTLVVTIVFSGIYTGCCKCKRTKRGNSDTFDILLHLYRINPLRKSSVFRSFSDTILLPTKEEDVTTHDSKESLENKDVVAKLIEETLHDNNNTIKDTVTYPPIFIPDEADVANNVMDFTGFEEDMKNDTEDVTKVLPAAKILSLAEEFIPNENIVVPYNDADNYVYQNNVVNSDEFVN